MVLAFVVIFIQILLIRFKRKYITREYFKSLVHLKANKAEESENIAL